MKRYLYKTKIILLLFLVLLWQIVWSSLKVMYWIIHPWKKLSPGVVQYPLELTSPYAITLLSYAITLTPGTLTLDVDLEKKILYLHTLFEGNQELLIDEIKSHFEYPIMELWQ